jgi:hypothetical protein
MNQVLVTSFNIKARSIRRKGMKNKEQVGLKIIYGAIKL